MRFASFIIQAGFRRRYFNHLRTLILATSTALRTLILVTSTAFGPSSWLFQPLSDPHLGYFKRFRTLILTTSTAFPKP